MVEWGLKDCWECTRTRLAEKGSYALGSLECALYVPWSYTEGEVLVIVLADQGGLCARSGILYYVD
jgi:hypothetical protein